MNMPAGMQFLFETSFNDETPRKSALNKKKSGTFRCPRALYNLAIRKNLENTLQVAKLKIAQSEKQKNNLQKRFQYASK
jgi:hypothetical protein